MNKEIPTDEGNNIVWSSKRIKYDSEPGQNFTLEVQDTKNEDEPNDISPVPVPDAASNSLLFPDKFVFSIDHLMEFIFSLLDEATLFHCRLVHPRWAFFGAKELQKMVHLKLSEFSLCNFTYNQEGDAEIPHGSIPYLTSLMKNSKQFPCASFEIKITWMNKKLVETFLNVHGAYVKKFHLTANLTFGYLKMLLSTLPHLKHLVLDVSFMSLAQAQNPFRDKSIFVCYNLTANINSTSSRDEIDIGTKSVPQSNKYCIKHCDQNLKILEIVGSSKLNFSAKIFFKIWGFCLKTLTRMTIPPQILYQVLVKRGMDQLCLLRKLQVGINIANSELLNLLADLSAENLSHVKELDLTNSEHLTTKKRRTLIRLLQVSPQVQNSVSKILENVSGNCEILKLPQFGNSNQIVVPVMPKVTQLQLEYRLIPGISLEFFPYPRDGVSGVRFGEMFPNLKNLFFKWISTILANAYFYFQNIRPDDDKSNVENIYIEGDCCCDMNKNNPPNEYTAFYNFFQKLFPDANFINNTRRRHPHQTLQEYEY